MKRPRWVGPFVKSDGHVIGVDSLGRAFAVAMHGAGVEIIPFPDPPPATPRRRASVETDRAKPFRARRRR